MIDTIKFKVLNLSNYGNDARYFSRHDKLTFGNIVEQNHHTNDGMKFIQKRNFKNEISREEYITSKITSASYDIHFDINLTLDFISFEFSIPKYLYGHNTRHFPENTDDFLGELKNFFLKFFKTEFLIDIDLCDIEILRIDFCYNYRFLTQANKGIYKENMLNLVKQHYRTDKVISYSDNQTAMYKTLDYSFKIYDKIEEFMKHDFEKVRRFRGHVEADEIRKNTCNVMRSEMTFRKRKISYEFFENIDSQNQVNYRFKKRVRDLSKVYNDCENILARVVKSTNAFLFQDIEFDSLIKYWYSTDIVSKYTNISNIDNYLHMIREIKSKGGYLKEYKTVDVKFLIKSVFLGQMAEYNKIRSPKQIRLQLTPFERSVQMNSSLYIDQIELNENYFYHLFDKFKSVIEGVNSNTGSEVSPLSALYHYRNVLKDIGFSLNPLKKYLVMSKDLTDKQLIKKKILTDRTIRYRRQEIAKINEYLRSQKLDEIGSIYLPEKIIFQT